MRFAILTAAAVLASTTYAAAQTFEEKVIEMLEKQGFVVTEVDAEGNLVTFEATRNGKERELIYDATTGELIKDEYDGDDLLDDDDDDDQDGDDDHDDDDDHEDDDHEDGHDDDSSDDSSDGGSDDSSDDD